MVSFLDTFSCSMEIFGNFLNRNSVCPYFSCTTQYSSTVSTSGLVTDRTFSRLKSFFVIVPFLIFSGFDRLGLYLELPISVPWGTEMTVCLCLSRFTYFPHTQILQRSTRFIFFFSVRTGVPSSRL